uniref:FERM domain-containing protein n=1 Tax=Brugia timori TaxID=42155 RepID=A0A0R3Q8Z9_9BILA
LHYHRMHSHYVTNCQQLALRLLSDSMLLQLQLDHPLANHLSEQLDDRYHMSLHFVPYHFSKIQKKKTDILSKTSDSNSRTGFKNLPALLEGL